MKLCNDESDGGFGKGDFYIRQSGSVYSEYERSRWVKLRIQWVMWMFEPTGATAAQIERYDKVDAKFLSVLPHPIYSS